MAKKAPSRVYPQPLVLVAGPFSGVTDAPEPPGADPTRLYLARNVYVTAGSGGKIVRGRPGFSVADDQIGAIGHRAIQWIGQFSLTDETEYSLAIAGGEIYSYDWGTDTFTRVIDATDLSGASITLDEDARVHCVAYFDELMVSDGINTPFLWNGTTGAGLTKLTNWPVVYGQPVVYYAKIFGIKDAERDTMVWCEEGTPNTGMEAGGYTNAWSLPGTKNEPMVALAARNDSLGIVRPRSTTTIIGAINSDFQTTGTRASVSERIGTASPGGVLVLDEGTIVLDADARPQFWRPGLGYAERPSMWEECQTASAAVPRSTLVNAQVVYDPTLNLILIGTGDVGSTNQLRWLAFERTGGVPNYVGTWDGFTATAHGLWLDDNGVTRWVHGTSDGYVYAHGLSDVAPFNDGFQAGDAIIDHEVVGPALKYDTDEDVRFDEMTVVCSASTAETITLSYDTSRGTATTSLVVSLPAGTGSLWDQAEWDVDPWAGPASGERRVRAGLRSWGRWLRPRIGHGEFDRTFGLEVLKVTAFQQGRWPKVE